MAAARNALVVTDAADDQCEIFCTNVAPKKEPGGSIAWAMTGQESGRRLAFLLERTP